MSEDKLLNDRMRAQQAKDLLEHPLLVEAFDKLKANYIDQWEKTTVIQGDLREKYWLAARIVGVVRDQLHKIIENGKLADYELERLNREAEHKKKFGLI